MLGPAAQRGREQLEQRRQLAVRLVVLRALGGHVPIVGNQHQDQRGQKERRDRPDQQQDVPIAAFGKLSEGRAQGNDRQVVSPLPDAGELAANPARKQAHVCCDQHRKICTKEDAQHKSAGEQLEVRCDIGTGGRCHGGCRPRWRTTPGAARSNRQVRQK